MAFFGTSDFATPILRALAEDRRLEVVQAVTQPDRPSGRGRRLNEPPVKAEARRLDLPVIQPTRLRSRKLLAHLLELRADFLVVASYGRILTADLLSVPAVAAVNVHASLLPAYRGAAPIQRALLDGIPATGVTTMWMNERMDEGDILLQERVEIVPSDTAGTLTERLARVGAELAVKTLEALRAGSVRRRPQDHAEATWAPPIGPDDAWIRWTDTAVLSHNRVRAMAPRPGAVARLAGRRLKVLSSEATRGPVAGGPPGSIVAVHADEVVVATQDGALTLKVVQPEGGRPMPASAWARGARVSVGQRFDAI